MAMAWYTSLPVISMSNLEKKTNEEERIEEEEEKKEAERIRKGEKRLLTGTCRQKKAKVEKRMTGRKEEMSFIYTHILQMDTRGLRLIFVYPSMRLGFSFSFFSYSAKKTQHSR